MPNGPDRNNLGEWTKAQRQARQLNPEQLAAALGLTKSAILAIESGRARPPKELRVQIEDYFAARVSTAPTAGTEFKGGRDLEAVRRIDDSAISSQCPNCGHLIRVGDNGECPNCHRPESNY